LSWHLPIIYVKNSTFILVVRDLKSLILIFKRSWRSGEVPEHWRKANILPAFKKDDLENYRPGSLTSVTGKVMEQILPKVFSKREG